MNNELENEQNSSGSDEGLISKTSKKRKRCGRVKDRLKKLRHSSHTTGEDCKCHRLKCFENVPLDDRRRIIREFNEMESYNKQNVYLGSLITPMAVQRHRKNPPDGARLNQNSFGYCIKVNVNDNFHYVSVCIKAFISIHGVTYRRIQTIKESLASTGNVKPDERGKHNNRSHKLSDETKLRVDLFLKLMKDRKTHYSLKDINKIDSPENLSVKKLHSMYKDLNPDNLISYNSFRSIFNGNLDLN